MTTSIDSMKINAAVARSISESSENSFKQIIEDVENEISDAATSGAVLVNLKNKKLTATNLADRTCDMNSLQKRVYTVLTMNGYSVRWTRGDTYVPKGLMDDLGNGPFYSMWYFQVGWAK